MSKKRNVAVFFGGRSAEHEISVKSAKNIMEAMDPDKYTIIKIGVTKQGGWVLDPKISPQGEVEGDDFLSLVPGNKNHYLLNQKGEKKVPSIDLVFPVLHGPYGEDGTIQGVFKLLGLPFVGSSVLGSALGMDKEVMKRILIQKNIKTAKYETIYKYPGSKKEWSYKALVDSVGLPFFVKPANLGSSVGISKVTSMADYQEAKALAFTYDTKAIVESQVIGKEIECAVLGNDNPKASHPGEVVSQHDFYSYEAKYLDEKGAVLTIPAQLEAGWVDQVQELAVKTYQALCLEGLTRVDFFLTEEGDLFVNEVNTMPGFTRISMYPKLWEEDGLAYSDLIDQLIDLAMDRQKKENQLKTSI